MSRNRTSILLFSDDKEISASVQKALSSVKGLKLQAEETSVADINGHAFDLASENDIVIFATDPDNAGDIAAIHNLDQRRADRTIFLALTDSNISLARARALSDVGVDDVLPYPMPEAELTRQIERWIKKLDTADAGGGHEGIVIPVVQARGGIGSTTVAVNLADHLLIRKSRFKREAGNKVALVDLDLQFGSVGDFLEVEPQNAIFQMAAGGVVPDETWVEQSMAETAEGLKVLTAPADFMPLDSVNEPQIEALVQTLRRSYDYVVLDLPRALVSWIQPVMNAADELIVVTDTTVPSIRSSKRLIDFYKSENPGLKVNVVINHEKRPLVQGQHHKEAAKVLEQNFEHWLPHDPKAARASVDYGKPLSAVASRSDLNKSIAALAKATLKALPVAARASH